MRGTVSLFSSEILKVILLLLCVVVGTTFRQSTRWLVRPVFAENCCVFMSRSHKEKKFISVKKSDKMIIVFNVIALNSRLKQSSPIGCVPVWEEGTVTPVSQSSDCRWLRLDCNKAPLANGGLVISSRRTDWAAVHYHGQAVDGLGIQREAGEEQTRRGRKRMAGEQREGG